MLGTLVLVNIFLGMHLAHIVYVNFLAIIDVLFETHTALHHVPIRTLGLVYVFVKMCLALTMVYIFVRMRLALQVPFKTLAMAYVFIKMHLALHVLFKVLAMVYIFIRICLASHVPIGTLVMIYVFIETCIAPTMVTYSLECTLPIIASLKHRKKSIMPFKLKKFYFIIV
jgi:hypothetical protein